MVVFEEDVGFGGDGFKIGMYFLLCSFFIVGIFSGDFLSLEVWIKEGGDR